jgi:2-polyprenyl-3-methyl-5-hydroxy-6-metoxy-1,4-benzoquinol methylase/glycosyltransferase involved in cell wall biosynthesis
LGEYAHAFIESTYHDALIIQRATGVLRTPIAAKTSFLWLHDLALIRQIPGLRQDLYQYDGMLSVSSWHRDQIAEVWEVSKDHITVVPNSVDRSLYDVPPKVVSGGLKLFYQSRPERGIDYLIAPGGIMERLLKRRPESHLYVAGYDNSPEHMQGYYAQVYRRIEELPNCTRLPFMDKATLAKTQKGMDLLVYPSEFEETSCITAMEAQAAGLPFLGSACGALPETCEGGGAKLVPLKDGKCDAESFFNYLTGVERKELDRLRKLQQAKAESLDWARSAEILDELIHETFRKKQRNRFSMARSMLDRSDVMLFQRYADEDMPEYEEFREKYAFATGHEGLLSQYDADSAVSEIEKDSNLDMSGNTRFLEVASHLLQSDPAHVLDYGCQKGHYLWTLAHMRPEIQYVGVDISPRVIEWANKHARVNEVSLSYKHGDVLADDFCYDQYGKFDGLILGEVLEHVPNPVELCSRLEPLLTDGARVVISTPFGDWEGKDFHTRPDAPRYHLHHFERTDLNEMFGHHEGYLTTCVPAGRSVREPLGSWVTTFVYRKDRPMAREIDWERKLSQFVPRETVSFCALARNCESTVLRSLLSVREIVDEFIIALDKTTTDDTRQVLERFRDQHCRHKRFVIVDAESPLEIGFDEARNRTIDLARGDWILWMDTDEDLIYPERLVKFLRHNQYDGYAIPQNHMSADPVGILTTDYPVRAFRRVPYLRFNGVVHEHPDDTERMNCGPRHPAMLGEVHILHHGYTTEKVRRDRFYRNLPLIKRDRKENPDRILGKLLWMRDLSHMCMFHAEQTGGYVTPEMRKYAEEGIAIFEGLLEEAEDNPVAGRMLRDGIEYYSNLVSVLGEGFETEFQLHCAKQFGQAKLDQGPRRKGRFRNRDHFERYMKSCFDEQMQGFEKRYW